MSAPNPELNNALDKEDPIALAHSATTEELERLKQAEAVVEARYQRKKRGSRFLIASQALVGYVALGGLVANAFQSYTAQRRQDDQAQLDQKRWSQEFDRAQQADKYRAFF